MRRSIPTAEYFHVPGSHRKVKADQFSRRFSNIAVDPSCASEIVLTHLVLAEKFCTPPKFIPMTDALETGLAKADGALAVDLDAWALRDQSNKLDLVDEWYDLTELPYVHGFWAFREGVLEEIDFKQFERQSLSQTGGSRSSMMMQNTWNRSVTS